ncbi:hypothetical protein [Accumulibacter sp.]|uniref:hypothetical protein n=1 Tax=Accumulibacter sp. TaxID=2053492 RepID=UPI0026269EF9|nr:hypothetical protein [Accumulibacter sp.]
MSKELFIAPSHQRPVWLEYPHSFCRLVEQGLIHLTPWHIMEVEWALVHARGLGERYPGRELFPFAYRQDNDDVACWSSGAGEKVFVIHDFASPGWEDEAAFSDVWAWFRSAIDETIAWE